MFRKIFRSSSKSAPNGEQYARLNDFDSGHPRIDPSLEERERELCRELLAQRAEQRREAERTRGIGGATASQDRQQLRQQQVNQRRAQLESRRANRASSSSVAAPPVLLTIIRSSAWTSGGDEDIWQVEVDSDACVWEVKFKIEELYDIPIEAQRLQALEEDCESWSDDCSVEVLAKQPFYLVPDEVALRTEEQPGRRAMEAEQRDFQEYEAAMQESAEACMALEQSLRDIRYTVRFVRPESAGGLAAGRSVTLRFDALALIDSVQATVEVELFGGVGRETQPVILTFNGQPLPPHMPLHCTGVGDQDTIIVASELISCSMPDDDLDDNSFDAAMRKWAAGELPPVVI